MSNRGFEKQNILRPSLWRILVIGILLSLLVAGSLYLHATSLSDYQAYLLTEEKKNTAWIVEQLSFLLPLLTVMLFQLGVYRKHNRLDGVAQREMAWEVLIVIVCTYLVLLPVTYHISQSQLEAALAAGEAFPKRPEGGAYDTLFLNQLTWFLRLAVGLGVLYVYHTARARREAEDFEMGLLDGEPIPAEGEPTARASAQTTPAEEAEAHVATEEAEASVEDAEALAADPATETAADTPDQLQA